MIIQLIVMILSSSNSNSNSNSNSPSGMPAGGIASSHFAGLRGVGWSGRMSVASRQLSAYRSCMCMRVYVCIYIYI